jgi:hypothetical protein
MNSFVDPSIPTFPTEPSSEQKREMAYDYAARFRGHELQPFTVDRQALVKLLMTHAIKPTEDAPTEAYMPEVWLTRLTPPSGPGVSERPPLGDRRLITKQHTGIFRLG